ncbi:MAG TPA: CdaR family protein [Methylomirabilota bacterium]|nr:CdaR family protein [Methylomirabilota bacterium]
MRRALARYWELKLLSVILAVALWLFVASAQRSEIALAVPVEYIGLEGPLALEGPQRETVEVQVRATRWAAERVSPASVRVRVDVAGLREGDNLVHLMPESVQVPPGVRVMRVAPAWATVRVVRAATKTVPVVARVQGTPASAHVMRRVVVVPATVQIKGPHTTIEERTAVDTLPVDVSGHRQAVTRTVGLVLPESVYAVDRRTVEVTVDIRPEETMQEPSSGGTRR